MALTGKEAARRDLRGEFGEPDLDGATPEATVPSDQHGRDHAELGLHVHVVEGEAEPLGHFVGGHERLSGGGGGGGHFGLLRRRLGYSATVGRHGWWDSAFRCSTTSRALPRQRNRTSGACDRTVFRVPSQLAGDVFDASVSGLSRAPLRARTSLVSKDRSPSGWITIRAKKPGRCDLCGKTFTVGTRIRFDRGAYKVRCLGECMTVSSRPRPTKPEPPQRLPAHSQWEGEYVCLFDRDDYTWRKCAVCGRSFEGAAGRVAQAKKHGVCPACEETTAPEKVEALKAAALSGDRARYRASHPSPPG